jgi:hypothetical protein
MAVRDMPVILATQEDQSLKPPWAKMQDHIHWITESSKGCVCGASGGAPA